MAGNGLDIRSLTGMETSALWIVTNSGYALHRARLSKISMELTADINRYGRLHAKLR